MGQKTFFKKFFQMGCGGSKTTLPLVQPKESATPNYAGSELSSESAARPSSGSAATWSSSGESAAPPSGVCLSTAPPSSGPAAPPSSGPAAPPSSVSAAPPSSGSAAPPSSGSAAPPSSEFSDSASCPAPSLVSDGSSAAHENPRSFLKPRRSILKVVRFKLPDAGARKKKRRPRRKRKSAKHRSQSAPVPYRYPVEVHPMKLLLDMYEKIELGKYNDHIAGIPPAEFVEAHAPKRKHLKRSKPRLTPAELVKANRALRPKRRKRPAMLTSEPNRRKRSRFRRSLSDEPSSDPGRGSKPSRLRVWSRNLS